MKQRSLNMLNKYLITWEGIVFLIHPTAIYSKDKNIVFSNISVSNNFGFPILKPQVIYIYFY